ncbi:MAG: PIN domain-containing protein [Cellvibrionaceae bacterium]|nr:PIN domain-containing protein [Cellvibrionaceae bacterium]
MAEILVDSCVLLDIFNDDPKFSQWSIDTLVKLHKSNTLIINAIIFSEVAFNFDSAEALIQVLDDLGIQIRDIPLPAAFEVSRVFKRYRKNKGTKNSALPDFYIGAHAEYLSIPIVTRDVGRYKSYYPKVKLIIP